MICCPRQRLIKEDNTTYRVTKCHGTVKNFASRASDDNLLRVAYKLVTDFWRFPNILRRDTFAVQFRAPRRIALPRAMQTLRIRE